MRPIHVLVMEGIVSFNVRWYLGHVAKPTLWALSMITHWLHRKDNLIRSHALAVSPLLLRVGCPTYSRSVRMNGKCRTYAADRGLILLSGALAAARRRS